MQMSGDLLCSRTARRPVWRRRLGEHRDGEERVRCWSALWATVKTLFCMTRRARQGSEPGKDTFDFV